MSVESEKISFTRDDGCDFVRVLRSRINQYFQEKGISSKANGFMCFKSIFLIGMMILTYSLIMMDFSGGLGVIGLYTLYGFVISIVGINIFHDALHGSYLSNAIGNRALGLIGDLLGTSSFYWKKEHTVDHHTFTNVHHHDADLDAPFLLRLCPEAPYYSFHRFQNWYAPFLYSLNLLRWVLYSDFRRFFQMVRKVPSRAAKPSLLEIFFLFGFKAIHFTLFLILPMCFLSVAWWQVLLGYVACLATMGITLTIIFQLAHIVENVAFPTPNAEGKIENTFVKHQLMTTANFARKSWLVSFLTGGLNFQIEHHIFPHICHTHLPKISPIVKKTALEFGLPYYENPSFFAALKSHFRTLKRFGQAPLQTEDIVLS
ncbi:MAG: acyl-CoA desaturase [Rhabdochlamydiaceae bacterium]|nr:acyl-CoA desaturase [Rhabdochlamydiaceae bacterium]